MAQTMIGTAGIQEEPMNAQVSALKNPRVETAASLPISEELARFAGGFSTDELLDIGLDVPFQKPVA
jgi:hypothetical protein